MEDKNYKFTHTLDQPSSKSPNFVPTVLITNTLCFSTVLLSIFFLSVIAYKIGLLEVIAGYIGISSTIILTYIFALTLILIVIGCFIAKDKRARKYIEDHFGIRKIKVDFDQFQNEQMH